MIPARPTAPHSLLLRSLKKAWRTFDRQRRAAQNQIATVRIVRQPSRAEVA